MFEISTEVDHFLRLMGFVFFIISVYQTLKFIYRLALQGRKKLKKGKDGAWAVVTGASDGLGKEFCLQLADQGYNICLLSRTEAKLNAVAKECERNDGVETRVIPVDFSKEPAQYEEIIQQITGLKVEVLVNNVGISFPYPMKYGETEVWTDESILNINIMSMLKMTRLILPTMVENKKGTIFNLGSFSGDFPVPLLSTYSASKAFVDFYSNAVHEEYKKDGIVVKCPAPMFVATEMAKMRESFTVPSPKRLVKDVLKHMDGPVTYSPYWVHRLITMAMGSLHDSIRTHIIHTSNRGIQIKAQKKLARQSAAAKKE